MKNRNRKLARLLSLALAAALLAGVLLVTAAAAEAVSPLEKSAGSFLEPSDTDASLSADLGQVMADASDSKHPGVFQLHFTAGSKEHTISAFYVTDGEKSYIASDCVVENQGADSFTLTGMGDSISADYLGADNVLAYFKADGLGNYQPLELAVTPADEVKLLYAKNDDNGSLCVYVTEEIDLSKCKTEDGVDFNTGLGGVDNSFFGMPVISSDNKVVGATYVSGENRNLMIFRFVGSTYQFASQYALSKSEDNTKLYLILGAAAVAAFLFYYTKKDGKKPQQSNEGSISLETSGGVIPDKNANQPSFPADGQDIYGPTVPNPSTTPQPSSPQRSRPLSPALEHLTVPVALWQLRGVEGPLSGKVYPLGGSLTIGRSAQCDVRFSQDAPGISGVHCQVSVRDDKVYLQDLGSSYGTFYPKNNRLNPKTDCLLHEGEVFNLAQGGGAFRLEKAGAAADTRCIVIKDMNGKTYKSGASMRITLGRNPGCQGGFGSDETSVSGRHCELYREGGKLYLMDLDSTNGTFFSQQERLRPNEPYRVRKGMAFFLTTPKYTFVVVEE